VPFLDEIVARLESQSVGTFNVNIFVSPKPAIPLGDGPYLSIAETGGTTSMKTQNNTGVQRPTAQLVARAKYYLIARGMLKLAYDALGGANGLFNTTLSGTFYLSIKARQEPTDMGILDSAGRALVTFNIEAEKQPS